MVEAATLRSGYDLKDLSGFADRIENMLRRAMGISLDETVEEEPTDEADGAKLDATNEDENVIDDDTDAKLKEEKQSTTVCIEDISRFLIIAMISSFLCIQDSDSQHEDL